MNTVKCHNGHFYDADRFDECPHCIKTNNTVNNVSIADKKSKKNFHKSPFKKKDDEVTVEPEVVAEKKPDRPKKNFYNEVTVALYNFPNIGSHAVTPEIEEKNKNLTPELPVEETISIKIEKPSPSIQPIHIAESISDADVQVKPKGADDVTPEFHEIGKSDVNLKQDEENTTNSQTKAGNSENKIVEPLDSKSVSESFDFSDKPAPIEQSTAVKPMTNGSKTVGFYHFDTEPVVGWLVCLTDDIKGKCFKMKAGQNSIGSSGIMDVYLPPKKERSSQRYAAVVFEPQKQTFLFQTARSVMCTVNSSEVIDYVPLKNYDVLQIGEYTLVFKSLCGEKFNWKDYE